ncbi:MAG: hypothetical protein RI573_04805 [Balneolaceae bacterium]|nr:hypothetical protein [Balneolaceae bacterium]
MIFKDFTKSQREILFKIYFDQSRTIQQILRLYLPRFNEERNEIDFRKETWEAKLNPNDSELSEILSSWEKEFNEVLEREEKLMKDHNS